MGIEKTPLTIDGINESLYAGFWIRLGSLLIDLLVLLPLGLFFFYLNGFSINASYFTCILSFAFSFWYSVYLVKRFGGTPGKLIVGIKIIKLDGLNISWKEAILREIVTLLLTIFSSIVTWIALSKVDLNHYESLRWFDKQQYIVTLTPFLFTLNVWITNVWSVSELIVLLLNKRKRALHDYIAGTVVVKSDFVEKIREVMSLNENK